MRTIAMARTARWTLLAVALLALAACAAGPGGRWEQTGAEPAGFFAGLWHGLILVVTLVVSFFTGEVRIYEVANAGAAYDVGFVLGALVAYGGGAKVTVGRGSGRGGRRADGTREDVYDRVERRLWEKVGSFLGEEDPARLREDVRRKLRTRLRRWLDEDGPPRPTA